MIKLEAYFLVYSFLLVHFLCNGVISTCFKHDGKKEDFMKLFIFSQMKFENISEFSLITLVSTLESRIIGGVGVIGGLYIVIIINDRGVGPG